MTAPDPSPAGAPARVLVFGASGHIGGPLARHVRTASPGTALRLSTSSPGKAAALERDFPDAEVVVTDYLDAAAVAAALEGVDRVFLLTPDFMDERRAMGNVAAAAHETGTLTNAVRIVGLPPGATPGDYEGFEHPGPAVEHLHAIATLRDGGVPLTVLNSAGYFMDDLLIHFALPLKRQRRLVLPYERRMCFTETGELGEAAARLLLADPAEHVGRTHHFNSGEDAISFADLAALLSEVLGTPIGYEPSPDAFVEVMGPLLSQIVGDPRAAERLLTDFRVEQRFEAEFVASSFAPAILGRRPTTLRAWLEAHRDALLAEGAPA